MTDNLAAELLPCPAGHLGASTNYDDEFEAWSVDCPHIDCTWRVWGHSEAEARAAWENRAGQTATEAKELAQELEQRWANNPIKNRELGATATLLTQRERDCILTALRTRPSPEGLAGEAGELLAWIEEIAEDLGQQGHMSRASKLYQAAALLRPLTALSPASNEAGTDWFKGEVDCDGNELVTIRADELQRLRDEREKFMWQVRDTCARAEKAEAGQAASNEAVEALREALEPFADMLGDDDDDEPDHTQGTLAIGRSIYYSLDLGDFRRARAALSASGKGEGK